MSGHVVTLDARTSARLICGGARALTVLARQAHRADRRAIRQDLARIVVAGEDSDALDLRTPRATVTGWDVA